MANTYTNDATASNSTTEQARIVRCNVSNGLKTTDVITIVTTNSVALCALLIGFNHVLAGAAANTHTGNSAGSTGPAAGALTTGAVGDLVLGSGCCASNPAVTSPRDGQGNTMTEVTGAAPTGQSKTSWGLYLVEAGTAAYNPTVTLGTSQAWAVSGARYANDGSSITNIASSDASTGWTADPGNKTFTLSPGAAIPAGATIFLFIASNGNTGTNTITDNAGLAPPFQHPVASPSTLHRLGR